MYEMVIEKETDDSGCLAYSPTRPGCFSNGGTVEETKQGIRDAGQQHLVVLHVKGQAIPQVERIVHVEEFCVWLS